MIKIKLASQRDFEIKKKTLDLQRSAVLMKSQDTLKVIGTKIPTPRQETKP